ncbi:MAG: histidinol dehydrogenase [Alphaproteobacteria bacterium]
MVAARIAGVANVYKCGGARRGRGRLRHRDRAEMRQDRRPGSPWVVAAKRVLAGVIDTGLPAGPSEAIVLADETADGAIAALDLIVESEHGPDSSAFLVTNSRKVAETARDAIPGYWGQMGEQRVGYSSTVLCGPRGGIVLAPDIAAAIGFVNDYAPEHLEIVADEPMTYLGRIRNAGEVLLGASTPVPLGNFVLGPNAVLPTSGAARTHSPLSTYDYMKRISIGQVTAAAYPEMARHAERLARYEGFDGHANAVSATRDRVMAAGKARA